MKRTILVVDDNNTDVDLIRHALGSGPDSPQLIVAYDGVEALRILRERPAHMRLPDLILLDLNLPRKSGMQTLAEVKEDPALKHIPVVILSSSSAERDISGAYSLHANCYFIKPMDIDGFAAALRGIEEFWLTLATLPMGR